jgi:hypothetical protein
MYKIVNYTEIFFQCMTSAGYKGLPQGSVLSPFLYNIIESWADRFIPSGCGFLQYADDLVVYMAHRLINITLVDWFKLLVHRWMVYFFLWAWRYLLESWRLCCLLEDTNDHRYWLESDPMCYLRRHVGYIFRFWVAIELPFKICAAKIPPKGELVEIGGRCFFGDSLDRSWNMARFVLRIWQRHICWVLKGFSTGYDALGLMGSTLNNCLGVLSGIPPLVERFAYLNFRYLVAAFYRLGWIG